MASVALIWPTSLGQPMSLRPLVVRDVSGRERTVRRAARWGWRSTRMLALLHHDVALFAKTGAGQHPAQTTLAHSQAHSSRWFCGMDQKYCVSSRPGLRVAGTGMQARRLASTTSVNWFGDDIFFGAPTAALRRRPDEARRACFSSRPTGLRYSASLRHHWPPLPFTEGDLFRHA